MLFSVSLTLGGASARSACKPAVSNDVPLFTRRLSAPSGPGAWAGRDSPSGMRVGSFSHSVCSPSRVPLCAACDLRSGCGDSVEVGF